MKYILFAIVSICVYKSSETTTIKIKHIGFSDKPIQSLCITDLSTTCKESNFAKSIIVTKTKISLLEQFVLKEKSNFESKKKQEYETGAFEITLEKNSRVLSGYIIDKRVNAILYLNQMLKISPLDNDLRKEIEGLLKRIEY